MTARKEGLRYSRNALLDDPTYNLTIGSAHLSHLLTRFNGSRIMTFAAYNAGPMRVEEWVGRYGDPRSDDVDPIDWVEQIPFAETRNYVQRVLENTQVYRSRLTEKPIADASPRTWKSAGPATAPDFSPRARRQKLCRTCRRGQPFSQAPPS
ncbi:MAG: lytic transglycosylase domain-containing protein [Parvularculaceae bacterium]